MLKNSLMSAVVLVCLFSIVINVGCGNGRSEAEVISVSDKFVSDMNKALLVTYPSIDGFKYLKTSDGFRDYKNRDRATVSLRDTGDGITYLGLITDEGPIVVPLALMMTATVAATFEPTRINYFSERFAIEIYRAIHLTKEDSSFMVEHYRVEVNRIAGKVVFLVTIV